MYNDELLRYEASGKLVVLRYTEQTKALQEELIDLISSDIKSNDFYSNDSEKQSFMRTYFKYA